MIYAAIPPNIPLLIIESYISSLGFETLIMDTETYPQSDKEIVKKLNEINLKLLVLFVQALILLPQQCRWLVLQDCSQKLTLGDYITFISGGHPTVLPERTLIETGVDFVVMGEGYSAISEIISFAKSKTKKNDIPSVAYNHDGKYVQKDIDELLDIQKLPRINWNKLNIKDYSHNWHCFGEDINNRSPYAIIWTNQGCPYPCNFHRINNILEKDVID